MNLSRRALLGLALGLPMALSFKREAPDERDDWLRFEDLCDEIEDDVPITVIYPRPYTWARELTPDEYLRYLGTPANEWTEPTYIVEGEYGPVFQYGKPHA